MALSTKIFRVIAGCSSLIVIPIFILRTFKSQGMGRGVSSCFGNSPSSPFSNCPTRGYFLFSLTHPLVGGMDFDVSPLLEVKKCAFMFVFFPVDLCDFLVHCCRVRRIQWLTFYYIDVHIYANLDAGQGRCNNDDILRSEK